MRTHAITLGVLLLLSLSLGLQNVSAQTKDELQSQIEDRNSKIKLLEAEIIQTQKDLDTTSKEKQTLQSAVKTLDLSKQKVQSSVSLTQNKIAQKDTEISGINQNIGKTTTKISRERQAIASTLQNLDREDNEKSLAVEVFSGSTLSSFFSNANALASVRGALQNQVNELSDLKTTLVSNKTDAESKRLDLGRLKQQLVDQKLELDATIRAKAELLTLTKSKESTYQALLKKKQEAKRQFEVDLANFESQLHLLVDPKALPRTGSGVLQWPTDKPVITQGFGNTDFSTANPQIYSGHGHNGIDLKANTGSRIKTALSGTVKGIGDTDQTCPNASYGRWVLVEHANGLSTLYAHLSVVQVSKGQSLTTGESVGLAGATGYATGPHLHFAVYATQGVQISTFASKSCSGRNYTMPVADLKAYLNPLSYL